MEILKYPNDKLREVASEVTKFDLELQATINQMFNLMIASNGVGLAATQVGINKRMLVMQSFGRTGIPQLEVLINPIITAENGTDTSNEGCLSFPGLNISVTRPKSITVVYKNAMGQNQARIFVDLDARIVQHEMDHLNGIVFIDKDNAKK